MLQIKCFWFVNWLIFQRASFPSCHWVGSWRRWWYDGSSSKEGRNMYSNLGHSHKPYTNLFSRTPKISGTDCRHWSEPVLGLYPAASTHWWSGLGNLLFHSDPHFLASKMEIMYIYHDVCKCFGEALALRKHSINDTYSYDALFFSVLFSGLSSHLILFLIILSSIWSSLPHYLEQGLSALNAIHPTCSQLWV